MLWIASGSTVRSVFNVVAPSRALIVARVDAFGSTVCNGTPTLDSPSGTSTVAGTGTTAAALLDRLTRTPPRGAGPLRPTWSKTGATPMTRVGTVTSSVSVG